MSRKGGTPENLILFKKGEKGISPGHPRGKTFKTILRDIANSNSTKLLPKEMVKKYNLKSVAEAVCLKLFFKAMKGDIKAIKEVIDRVDGKAVQRTELSGANGKPISIEIIKKASLEELNEFEKQVLDAPVSSECEEED